MRFGSVCSGIEAASVAWKPLGWTAAWFSEIEPFPCSVLRYRFPTVPNHGDMTTLPARIRRGEVEAPDVFCGGTPCQAFSVAGLRKSLGDARGNLSLTYCEIDDVRIARGDKPCIPFWENVPGVLSTADNAFGCFLAGLAGHNEPLEPGPRPEPGRSSVHWRWEKKTGRHVAKWPDAGVVVGPRRTVAWRLLDAQYFDLAQRRARVFVVASAGDDFDPAAVLFEFEGLRRDTPPSREAREEAAGDAVRSAEVAGPLDVRAGGGFPGTDGACSGHVVPTVGTLRATDGGADLDHAMAGQLVPAGCWWDGGQVSQTLDAVLSKGQCMPEKNRFPAVLQPVAFDTTQITSKTNRSNPRAGDTGHPLAAGAHPPTIAFSAKDHGADAALDLAPTLRAGTHSGSHANGGVMPAIAFRAAGQDGFTPSEISPPICASDGGGSGAPTIAFPANLSGTQAASTEELAPAMGAKNPTAVAFKPSHFTRGKDGAPSEVYPPLTADADKGDQDPVVAVAFQDRFRGDDGRGYSRPPSASEEITGTLETVKPWNVATTMQVRRLTVRECERLQGFEDDFTLVPHGRGVSPAKLDADYLKYLLRGNPKNLTREECAGLAADGPRYKALGNSWAIYPVRWIGARIDAAIGAADRSR
jgi:DNA (cytosine-5)-methyltransferase 1